MNFSVNFGVVSMNLPPNFENFNEALLVIEHISACGCSAKTQNREFETNVPRKGIVIVSDLYIPNIVLTFCCRKICGSILGIYKSLTDT